MPTTPCLIHSQATLPTFTTYEGVEIFVSNGCVQRAGGPKGIDTLAHSLQAEAWLRENVPMSEPLAVLLQRLRWMTFDSRPGRERNK